MKSLGQYGRLANVSAFFLGLLICFTVSTTIMPGQVQAYVRTTTDAELITGLGDTIFWDLTNSGTSQAEVSNDSIRWYFHQAGSDDISDGSDLTAVQEAWNTWQYVGLSKIGGIYMGSTTITATVDDDVFPVFFWETSNVVNQGTPDPNDDIDMTGAVAMAVFFAYTTGPERGEIFDGNVAFNGYANQFTTTGQSGRYDIEKVAVHELGHDFGADHVPCLAGIMWYGGYSSEGALGTHRSLGTDEISMIGGIYPTNCFSSVTATITGTIRDSGGNPVFGAHVIALANTVGLFAASALSQDDGSYTIKGLSPGSYSLYVDSLDNDTDAFFNDGFYLFSRLDLISQGWYEATNPLPNINTAFRTSGPHAASNLVAGSTRTVDITLPSGVQTIDIDMTGDCTNGFSFLPRVATAGSTGNVIAVAGPNLPQSGTPLIITGNDITITSTTFPCYIPGSTSATDLDVIQVTYSVSTSGTGGPRLIIVDNGSEKTLISGAVHILPSPVCLDGNEPNDKSGYPTPIACTSGGGMASPPRTPCIGDANDQDWYVFSTSASTRVTISVNDFAPLTTVLVLADAAGVALPNGVVYGPNPTISNYQLPSVGCYLVMVASVSGYGGNYSIQLSCIGACPSAGTATFDTDQFGAPLPIGIPLDNQYRLLFGLELANDSFVDRDVLSMTQVMVNYDPLHGVFVNDDSMVIAFTDSMLGFARQTANCVSFDVMNTPMMGPSIVTAEGYDVNGQLIAVQPGVPAGNQVLLQAPPPPANSIAWVRVLNGGGPPIFAIDNVNASIDNGAIPIPCMIQAQIAATNGVSFCEGEANPLFDMSGSVLTPPLPVGCSGIQFAGGLDVQWYLDGNLLPGETGMTLDLAPYALTAGAYMVDVTVACPLDDLCIDDTRMMGRGVPFTVFAIPPMMGNSLTMAKNTSDEPVFMFPLPPNPPPPTAFTVLYDTDPQGDFLGVSTSGPTPPLTETPGLIGSPLYYYIVRADNGPCPGPEFCTETLDPAGPGGVLSSDWWEFDTTVDNTTVTVVYRNNDDMGGIAHARVGIEVYNAGCVAPLGLFQMDVDCDYPPLGGPTVGQCPLATMTLSPAGTWCFKILPLEPIMGEHCYWIELSGDFPVTDPVLIGDDQP